MKNTILVPLLSLDALARMQIALDAREALSTKRTGKGMWTAHLIEELLSHEDVQLILCTSGQTVPLAWQRRVQVQTFPSGLRWHFACAAFLRLKKPDVYLSTTSYILPAWLRVPVPLVTVVHDLIAFRNEPHDRKATFIERCSLKRALKHSRGILCLSNATAKDLEARFGTQRTLSIVGAGPTVKTISARSLSPKGIFCLATLCPRKNQLRLLQAFASLPEALQKQHPLLLVGGRGWHDEEILRTVEKLPYAQWRGYLTDSECIDALCACAVFAYPSLYEGFGLPVLDALTLGVPVLTSNRGSLQEVAGDGALQVDPLDAKAIAIGLQHLLTDPVLRENFTTQGKKEAMRYSWKITGERVMEAISAILMRS